MLKTLQDLFLVFTSILFIVDPLTAVPTFLAMTARDPPEVRRQMAKRGAWTCAITLMSFTLGGSLIFRLFGITLAAAPRVEQKLGQTGMRILTRLMGLVLCAIAVQFILDGIKMAGL